MAINLNFGVPYIPNSTINLEMTPTVPSVFSGKVAQCPSNCIKPNTQSYVASWATALHNMGVKTLRLQLGGEGDVWGTNMDTNVNWAQNLDALLTHVANAGFNCYFYSLGTQWGGLHFGNDQASPITMSVATAKTYIDKLAGNNSLNHNFITDPRYAMWSIANENNLGTYASPNSNYYWVRDVADYIRSKGGKVSIAAPVLGSDPGNRHFAELASMLYGHTDLFEFHSYEAYDLVTYYKTGNETYNWAGWRNWMKTYIHMPAWNAAINAGFPPESVYIGEFGMWRGINSDLGLSNYTFTDQNRVDYYTHYFAEVKEVGIKNLCFHTAIKDWVQRANNDYYGMISCKPFSPWTEPEGTLLRGSEVIASNFL